MSEGARLLEGQVALVTGAGRGLGRAFAERLAAQGALIGVHGMREHGPAEYGEGTTLTATAQEIGDAHGVRTCRVLGDLTDSGQVAAVVRTVENELGAIDILVHNAGGDIAAAGGKPDPNDAVMIKEADVRAVLERNLLSTILVCQEVARGMMARRRGRILTISSIAAFKGRRYSAIYATAKAGVVHYTRCLADQLRPYDVAVNSLAPGDTRTGRFLGTREVDPRAPRRGRHARADRHRRRGGAGGGVLRRAARRLRLGPGAARRRRRAMLAGVGGAGPSCRRAQQLAGDDRALDLVGAFVDLGDLGVAVEALDLEAPDVAAAAEDLHGVGALRHRHVAGEALGHRAGDGGALAGIEALGRIAHQQARGLDVLGHVGEQPLHALELGDRPPELAARPGVVEGRLEAGLGDPDGERADPDPALVEHAHHHVEAAPLGAEQRVRRQRDVVEGERPDRRGALAHLVLLGAGARPPGGRDRR